MTPPAVLAPPVNALRLARDCAVAGDPALDALLEELRAYPIPPRTASKPTGAVGPALTVPLRPADPRRPPGSS